MKNKHLRGREQAKIKYLYNSVNLDGTINPNKNLLFKANITSVIHIVKAAYIPETIIDLLEK